MFSIVLITLSAVNAVSADSSIIYVNDSGGNDSWDGQYLEWQSGTLSGPKKSIKNATGTVSEGGTVQIANGVYTGTGNTNITISKNITITGQNKNKTIINGTDTNWIFKIISGVNVTIQNSTLTHGNASFGGAIYNNGTLTVSDCIFTNNKATAFGGAISNYNGTISSLNGCIFKGNSAGFGGAIDNNYRTIGTVIDCIFTGNNAIYGGAISNYQGNITTLSGVFTNNTASKSGGAILNYHSTILAANGCIFTGNNATDSGGAIYNDGTINMHFNMFADNTATNGSAIYCNNGSVDAEYNWWGSNDDPSGKINGFTVSKWLVLMVNANPTIIKGNSVSIITVDLLYDNQGNYHDPTLGHVPDGITVNFNTNLGNISSSSSTFNGITQSNLNGGLTNGVSNVSVTVDSQTVDTLINVDTISPTVTTTSPANNAKTNLTNKVITITFSEPIQAGSAYDGISVTGPLGAVSIIKNINGNVLTITPTSSYNNGNYIINIPANAVTDLAGNGLETVFTSSFTVDTVPPTVTATPTSGLSNNSISVTLSSESNAKIYYRINSGSWHTFTGSGKVLISSVGTNKLEFYAVDAAGNPSAHKTYTYTIDKTAPKVISTYPKNGAAGVSRTATISIKFSENIKASINWSKIYIKNLRTGKLVSISKSISGNTLKIKMSSKRYAYNWYQVYIPKSAVKDSASNNLAVGYILKFKTGKY